MEGKQNNKKQTNKESEGIYTLHPLSIQEKNKLLYDKITMQLKEQDALISNIKKEMHNQLNKGRR